MNEPVSYKYTVTKEYVDAFPCAYRQWRADTHCNQIHGYSFSFRLYFGSNELDSRNWGQVEYGGLKPLKEKLEDWFDHTLLLSTDDPMYDQIKALGELGIAKITEVEHTGCESIADFVYKYINGIFIEEAFGKEVASKVWCYKVEVRETHANMAFREGHREWNEDLYE